MKEKGDQTRSGRQKILGILSCVTTAALLVIIVYLLDTQALLEKLTGIDPTYILLLTLTATFQNVILLPIKLWWILAIDGMRISWYESLLLRMTGLSLKLLLPFKLGEAGKVVYLKQTRDYQVTRGVSVVLFDKITVLVGLAVLVMIGTLRAPGFRHLALPTGLILVLLTAVTLTPLLGWCLRRIPLSPGRMRRALEGLAHLFDRVGWRPRCHVLLYAVILMAYDMIYYYLAFRATGVHIPFTVILVWVPIVYLATAIPFTMQGVGAREGAVMLLMQNYGTAEQLFLAGALVSLFEVALFAVVGTAFFHSFFVRMVDRTPS